MEYGCYKNEFYYNGCKISEEYGLILSILNIQRRIKILIHIAMQSLLQSDKWNRVFGWNKDVVVSLIGVMHDEL